MGGGGVGGVGGMGGVRLGGQGGCERRSKDFVKIQKKNGGVGRGRGSKIWGRWVMWGMGDVNQE